MRRFLFRTITASGLILAIGLSVYYFEKIYLIKNLSKAGLNRPDSPFEKQNIFKIAIPSEPLSLDPARFAQPTQNFLFFNVMRGLVKTSPQGQIEYEGGP